MSVRRIKKTFTGGELDPLMGARLDFTKYKNGCRSLYNAVALPTGAATRRPGSKFITDLTAGPHPPNTDINVGLTVIPVVINASLAALLVMYIATDGEVWVASLVDDVISYSEISSLVPEIDPTNFVFSLIDFAQYGYNVYVAQPYVAPFYLKSNASATVWTATSIVFDHPPVDWVPGAYPGTVTFHQQRSIWGGNSAWPQKIWCSAVGLPHEMGDPDAGDPDAGLTADDGFSFNLESNNWDKIVWLESDIALNAGTLGHEWVITGRNGAGPISGEATMGGVEAVVHTSIGSKNIKPVNISGALNFVGKYGRNVYEFQFQFSHDKYMSSDKSILASHLTKMYHINRFTYQRVPNGILWLVTINGGLIGCTTIPEHKVTAWHHHDIDGTCLDVCSIPSERYNQDLLYVIVEREVNGVTHTMIERLSAHWTDPNDKPEFYPGSDYSIDYYLDSYKLFTNPGLTLTGLEHLAGRKVSLWADGMTLPLKVVNALGEVTLDHDDYTHVIAGLGYVSEVRPYLGDVATDEGSAFGQMQRVVALDIDFYKTIGGEIGVSYQEEDGTETETVEDLQFRTSSASMRNTIPRYTGIYHTSFLEGNDRKTEYFIRQRHPQPMTIRGIVDTVEVE